MYSNTKYKMEDLNFSYSLQVSIQEKGDLISPTLMKVPKKGGPPKG